MATKVIVALCLCLMVSSTLGQFSARRPDYRAQQCRINQLTSSEPNDRIECEGGLIEMWDQNEEQYQCSGINAMRITIHPNSLGLPNFHPFPRLVYVERGEGLLGVTFPGCPETYHSTSSHRQHGFQGEEEGQGKDLHQKVHRFRRGDVLAIPPGVVHWCYNDGNEDLVVITVDDLYNQANQLDQNSRVFYLAGGLGRSSQRGMRGQSRGGQQQFQNIFSAFDPELMAESFNVPQDLIRRMQESQDRTLIVRAERGEMQILSPESEEEDEESYERRQKYRGLDLNGLEETVCTMRLRHSLDNRKEADIVSRHGGRLNIVNEHKLPVLRFLDMSVEKGHMFPNTIYSPHWSMNSHSVVYVTRGEAHVQVVGNNGETVMDNRVSEGEMFVIPQFFTTICRAGRDGFEYVSFKTTSSPMKSPIVGYTSVFRAMPVQVLSNSFQISPSEAQELKFGREHQTFFLSPRGGSSRRI